MSIQQNIADYHAIEEAVKSHCMCAEYRVEGSKVIVIYPAGNFAVEGVRVDRTSSGLIHALERMEKDWVNSYPGRIDDL